MPAVQRKDLDEDEKPEVMTKRAPTHTAGGAFEAGEEFEQQLRATRGQGQPLPASLREAFETKLGVDFSGVRIHTDALADRLSQSIQAKAFTTGQHVSFRQGAYDPGSPKGQELIAHELTHVAQQKGGAVGLGGSKSIKADPICFHPLAESGVQRMPIDRKVAPGKIAAADRRLGGEVLKEDIEKCYVWAEIIDDFEVFTATLDAFNTYLSVKDYRTAEALRNEASGDTSEMVRTAEQIVTFATQTSEGVAASQREKKGKGREKETKAGGVPKELSMESLSGSTPTEARPEVGATLDDLSTINKNQYPSTFASTMIAIHKQGNADQQIMVEKPILLNGGRGTSRETVEMIVRLNGYFFVVHYHPKALFPEGPQSGESNLHVKGRRSGKHRETLTESALHEIDVPILTDIIQWRDGQG